MYLDLTNIFNHIIFMGIQWKHTGTEWVDILFSFVVRQIIWFIRSRDFFGTSSPYADLLDYLLKPHQPTYDVPEGKGFRKKQNPIYHPLCLTLHEVFFGGVKKMKIQKLTYISEDETRTEVREKILTIPIKPGIRPGTEIIFPEEGDQNPTQIPGLFFLNCLLN